MHDLFKRGNVIDGLVRLEVVDDSSNCRRSAEGIATGPHKDVQLLPWRAAFRNVNGGSALLTQPFVADVAHDADHLEFIFRTLPQVKELAHRIFRGPELPCQLLIDDHDRRMAGEIFLIECAAGDEWNLQCLEVSGSHDVSAGG